MIAVDFETRPIIQGSGLAPEPVGVSILRPGHPNVYYGWGHPGANPHSWAEARMALGEVWHQPLVFHHCKFDIAVAIEHMNLPWPECYDDTLFQSYLIDPLAKSLGLKKLAQKWLHMDPEERDAVYLWLKANFKGPFLPDHKVITQANAGAYISYAPYEIVAPYAMGDTARTLGLHELLRPKITSMGMDAAYRRELAVARIGYWMERRGVRVNREALEHDYDKYERIKLEQEQIIHSYLGDIDLDKRGQVGAALLQRGHARSLPQTPTGKVSTSKASLEASITDPTLAHALRYRGALKTLTQTFYKNWIKFSERDGHVHPSWNQVLSENLGARTGRFSCSTPNLTNVPTEFEEKTLHGDDVAFMRQYILPDEGHVIVPADYNGQEMRIMAHYAREKALEIYQDDPQADFHMVASALIKRHAKMTVSRKMCKIVGFSLIYGSGVSTLAKQLGVDTETAYKIKEAYFKAIPGLQSFIRLFSDPERTGIRTWGNRFLPLEPPCIVDGVARNFHYKLVNYLIQGSAADQTKEALVRYDILRIHSRPLMTVHDEIVISVPEEHLHSEVAILKESMEGMPGWVVPFIVDVEVGRDWHNLEKFTCAIPTPA